jgi:dihydroorotase
MFDLAIRNVRLVRSTGTTDVNIGITGGVVREVVAPGETLAGRDEIDATGKVVLPGLIDAHVHIPGFLHSKHLENFDTATRAAAAGGVTTIMLMPTDDPRTATPFYFAQKVESGTGNSHVDFAIQALVGPMTESVRELAQLGAISFEIFLSYGGNPKFIIGADDYELVRTMRMIRDAGGITGVTPHSPTLNARLTEDYLQDPCPDVRTIAATRPILSEVLGISRACAVASELSAPIHVRAVSSAAGVAMVRRFRNALAMSCEVMTHHLLFTSDDALRMGSYGVITPPLRSRNDRSAVQEAVRAGEIDMVVSDHSPALRVEKEKGQIDIWKSPPGMTGLQTLCLSMLSLVDAGKLTLNDVVRLCCESPARHFRLYPAKGAIEPGSDADMVFIDPSEVTLVEDKDQYSKADYTTFAGNRVKGKIELVLLRGKTVYHNGRFASTPSGRFVRPT